MIQTCSDTLFAMASPWRAQKSNNKTPLGFRSGRPLLSVKGEVHESVMVQAWLTVHAGILQLLLLEAGTGNIVSHSKLHLAAGKKHFFFADNSVFT